MKRYLTLFLVLLFALPSMGVLKERDLARTLGVLRLELEHNYHQQKKFLARYELMSKGQHQELVDYMKRSEQIGLMLYSQRTDNTFDVAYACQQATDLYNSLGKTNMPYAQVRERILTEVDRYDSLIYSLKCLPPGIDGAGKPELPKDAVLEKLGDSIPGAFNGAADDAYELNATEKKDREQCLLYAKALRNNLVRFLISLSKDNHHYTEVSEKVEKLYQYAQQRYQDLQANIYVNGERNYFSVLASFPRQVMMAYRDFTDKYMPLGQSKNYSEWRGPIVLSVSVFMLIYILLSILVSTFIVRGVPWLVNRFMPKAAEKFRVLVANRFIDPNELQRKKFLITMVLGVALFAILLTVFRGVFYKNLFLMAADLMTNLAWLMEAILLSLLIRLNGKQVQDGVKLYTPFITMAFIVILFRIVLIPNSIIDLIFPIISLLLVVWQVNCSRRHREKLPVSDYFYASISLATMTISCIMSWAGYSLLAVQVLIWWTFQLAAIQTITCIYDLSRMFEDRVMLRRVSGTMTRNKTADAKLLKRMHNGDFFTKTWLFDFVRIAVIPVLSVLSIWICVYFAAEVFEMTSIVDEVFFTNFIDQKGVVQVSLFKLIIVVGFFFIFRYINYAIRSYYHYWYRKAKKGDANFNETLSRNVTAIVVWGAYILFALVLLQVPKSGISVVAAGLFTGMGFAMKDLLENFFYGISLMTGRVRVGDYIECDGVLGKVDSITYQSTQIVTVDGSVIAFLNAALFNKNFKNLTRNHGYVLLSVPVGVAYGTNVEQVKDMLVKGLQPLRQKQPDGHFMIQPGHDVSVKFTDFGASSVDLTVYAWVWVADKSTYLPMAREIIYNVLNQNHIEIPFPQQDVYIRKITPPEHTSSVDAPAAVR